MVAIRFFSRIFFLIFLLVFILAACEVLAPGAVPGRQCENLNNIPVCDLTLKFFHEHNGLEFFGYPVTGQVRRGDMYVQYFSKAVIQYPAGNPRYEKVSLRQLGLELSNPEPPVNPADDPDCRYFARYGHLVCMTFLGSYDQMGGEAILGAPIGESKIVNSISVQDFENGRLKWVTDDLGSRVELESWGEEACTVDGLVCAYNGHREYADIVTNPSPIDVFVIEHGGVEVFGRAVGSSIQIGDRVYQYFENAGLIWDLYAPEPITLMPLGRHSAPEAFPIDPPSPSEDILFFPETGHSVVLAFRDFYLEYGGQTIFGPPLTEFMQDGDIWLQWFENVCFEWHPELPDGQRVQLSPLGDINYREFGADLPPAIFQSDLLKRKDVVLRMLFDYPLLPVGTRQGINVWVGDSVGRPLPGVSVTLYIASAASRQVVAAPATDVNGSARVVLENLEGVCGEMVQIRAVTDMGEWLPIANGVFNFWCNPDS